VSFPSIPIPTHVGLTLSPVSVPNAKSKLP
jgi:hypothetical protein